MFCFYFKAFHLNSSIFIEPIYVQYALFFVWKYFVELCFIYLNNSVRWTTSYHKSIYEQQYTSFTSVQCRQMYWLHDNNNDDGNEYNLGFELRKCYRTNTRGWIKLLLLLSFFHMWWRNYLYWPLYFYL